MRRLYANKEDVQQQILQRGFLENKVIAFTLSHRLLESGG